MISPTGLTTSSIKSSAGSKPETPTQQGPGIPRPGLLLERVFAQVDNETEENDPYGTQTAWPLRPKTGLFLFWPRAVVVVLGEVGAQEAERGSVP